MVKHVMADGTERDSLDGYILPKDVSETILNILKRKETEKNVDRDKSEPVKEK